MAFSVLLIITDSLLRSLQFHSDSRYTLISAMLKRSWNIFNNKLLEWRTSKQQMWLSCLELSIAMNLLVAAKTSWFDFLFSEIKENKKKNQNNISFSLLTSSSFAFFCETHKKGQK